MVTTRRNQPAAGLASQRGQSQSDQELPQGPALKTPRASRRKPTSKTATPTVATKRRLRSTKDGASPLRALPSPVKGKRKKTAVSVGKEPLIIESDSEAHAYSDAEGHAQPSHEDASKAKVQTAANKPGLRPAADASKTSADELDITRHPENEEDQTESDSGVGPFFTMRRKHAPFLFIPKTLDQLRQEQNMYEALCNEIRPTVVADVRTTEVLPLQARIEELESCKGRVTELESLTKTLRNRIAKLEPYQLFSQEQAVRIAIVEREYIALKEEHELVITFLHSTGQVNVNPEAIGKYESAPPPPVLAPKPSIEEAPEFLEGSERAIELLKKIESSARPRLARQREEAVRQSTHVANQSAAEEQATNTPGFFGRIISAFKSPFSRATPSQSPARAPSPSSATHTLPPADPPQELTLTLTPTPTPVGERSIKSKTAKSKNHRHAMVKAVIKAVEDPEEQRKAGAWAQSVLDKMHGSPHMGDKRKRIENGVRMGDLKHIPSQKPWVSTGYGMDDDIFDLSDSDDAPAWAVLRDMELDMESSKRPAKKRKSTHNVVMNTDVIASLNDAVLPPVNELSPAIFNSGGKTASLLDLQPRSSRIGSPMFDFPDDQSHGEEHETSVHDGNAQYPIQQSSSGPTRDQGGEAERHAALDREFRRTGHVPGTNAWCVPDHSSDEESDEETVEDAEHSSLWTQQPPPPPTPAHASLPAPVAESSATPPANLDPIELQRARITKHTPAKPSRLREVQVPSPSLRSDIGNESMTNSISAPATPVPDRAINKHSLPPIPDAESLDLPPEVRVVVEQYLETNEGHDYLATVSLWDDPVAYDFSDPEEV